MSDTDIPRTFDQKYYDHLYFSDSKGKKFRSADGKEQRWGYKNPDGHWEGCAPIAKAWKELFELTRCNTDTGLCKALDIGCGRGQFVAALRDVGIEGWGFDFSQWAIDNRYPKCKKEWVRVHDATQKWPYEDKTFDIVIALDLFEHIYLEDIDFILEEMYRVAKKWIFLQIATIGNNGNEKGYAIKKGEDVPIELEGMAVAGHVLVQPKDFWIVKLKSRELKNKDNNNRWRLRDDLVQEFIKRVDHKIIANWIKNTLIILERI